MTEPLGLSIGTTNLVAARVGRPPVTRRSVLTLIAGQAPQVGTPEENGGNTPSGVVLTGFVDRVGDPVPLVAEDGSAHRGEQVLAAALDAMARLVDGGSPVAIAVPSHWGPGTVGALRGALRSVPSLSPNGVPATLIPDSTAALASLRVSPGLPGNGVVVLVDLGGGGSSVTLADAGANLVVVGQTVRYPEFSGDGIDRALLDHVLAGVSDRGDADDADTAGTAAVGPLTRLREQCRAAKERLSSETATAVPVDLPGFRSDVRVTRPELEQMISGPLDGLLSLIDDTLTRNGVATENISAIATVGGGAAIPLVTQRLSERLRAPVVTTPQALLNIGAGAALIANQTLDADAPTGMAPTGMAAAADVPTAMGPAVDAPTALGPAAPVAGGALAWSQDEDGVQDPLPYTGADYTSSAAYGDGATGARPPVAFAPGDDGYSDDLPPLPWYKRPPVLFGLAAAAALLAVGGLAVTLTSTEGSTTVTETASTTPPSETTPVELPPPVTTVTIGPDGVATTTVSQPPPPPPSPTSSTTTTSPSSSTTTTTNTTTTTTTTTTAPTTTTTRTTTAPPTTTPPPTTTQAPPPPTTEEPPPTVDPPDPIVTTVIPDGGA